MDLPDRRNPRLSGFDYGEGTYYFITICTKGRERCLSRIVREEDAPPPSPMGSSLFVGAGHARPAQPCAVVWLTREGRIAENNLLEIPRHYKGVRIENYVIMPDHVHMIMSTGWSGEAAGGACPAPTNKVNISTVVGSFKASVSRACGRALWQRSFHDHILRGEHDYCEIMRYIDENPMRWMADKK